MPSEAQALVIDTDFSIALRDIHLPEMESTDLLIRTECSAVSIGTESLWMRQRGGPDGSPLISGYQSVGVIEATGSAVDADLRPGDRVAFRGTESATIASDGRQIRSINGGHVSRAVTPATAVVKIDADIDSELAAFYVSVGTGLHGMERAAPQIDEWVVVQGCGLIGLGVVAIATLHGAKVIAVDPDPTRLDCAIQLGAVETITAGSEVLQDAVRRITGDGAHLLVEATGIASLIPDLVPCGRRHGRFLFQGNYGDADVVYHFPRTHGQELTLLNTCGYGRHAAAKAWFRLLKQNAVPWQVVITHRLSPQDAAPVLQDTLQGKQGDVLGMLINWSHT